jgi:hypothetical protein
MWEGFKEDDTRKKEEGQHTVQLACDSEAVFMDTTPSHMSSHEIRSNPKQTQLYHTFCTRCASALRPNI